MPFVRLWNLHLYTLSINESEVTSLSRVMKAFPNLKEAREGSSPMGQKQMDREAMETLG
jgi:hypothetical protein